jgi:molecular chaperone DnaK
VPQIEVTFDIDANGIVKVKAKDLKTGNEQSIQITASTNLDDGDISRMVEEASKYAEDDAKRKAEIESKVAADHLIYQGEKMLKDFGEQVPEDLKREIEEKSERLKKAIEAEDFEQIKSGSEDLQQTIYKVSEKVYGSQGPGAAGVDPSQMFGGAGPAGAEPSGSPQSSDDGDEDAVDVDFEDLD